MRFPSASVRSALRAWAALVTLTAALLGLGAAPALAHDELTHSTPASGAHLSASPEKATLTFTNPLNEIGMAVLLEGPDGQDRTLAPTVSGRDLTVDLPASLSGQQRLKWRVVSADGHPVEGVVEFTVGTATGGSASAPAPSAAASTAPEASASAAPAEAASSSGGLPKGVLILLIALGGAVLAGGLYAGRALRAKR